MPDIVITPASNLIDSTGGTFTIRTADAQALSLKTNNSDALYIKSDGNVGIGTTNPDSKLMVANPSVAGLRIGFLGASQNIYDADTQFFRSGGGTERMRLDSNGTLLIGTTSTSSGGTLIVRGAKVNASYPYNISIQSTNTGLGEGGGIGFTGLNAGSFESIQAAIQAVFETSGTLNTDYKSALRLMYRPESTSALTEGFRLNSSGNIGIGTSSPYSILHLNVASASQRYFTISTTDGAGSYNAYGINLRVSDQGHNIAQIKGVYESSGGGGYGGLMFASLAGGTLIDRMRIQADGNIGIGITSASYKLDVYDTNVNVARFYNNQSSLNFILGSTNNSSYTNLIWYTSTGNAQFFKNRSSTSWGGADSFNFYTDSGGFAWHPAGNANLMYLTTAGNLGIGTSSPAYKLDVVGSVASNTGYIATGAFSGMASVYGSLMDYNSGNQRFISNANGSNGTFEWLSGNSGTFTSRLFINSSGNIGIGTTSPGAKLDIAGASANGIIMRFDTTTNYNAWIRPYWNSSTDSRIDFAINRAAGVTPDVILSVGYGSNVGIGTTSPAYKLDVSPVTSTVRLGRVLTGEWPTSANYALFGHAVLDHTNSGNYALLQGSAGDTFLNAASGQPIYFRIANSDKMILTSGGNVGIGTTSATQKLEVRGYVLSDLGAGVESGFYLGNSGHGTRRPAGTNDVYLYTSAGTVYLGANGNSSQHITINNSGNVGIGTTSPSSKFHVQNGNITLAATNIRNDWSSVVWNIAQWSSNTTTTPAYYMGFETDVANNRRFYISNKDNDVPNGGDPNGAIIFRTGTGPSERMVIAYGGNVGIGTTSPAYPLDVNGSCHASSFPTSSDKRFKKKIKPLENSLEKIKKVNGVSYEWNEFINERRNGYDLNSTIIGVIAQEVEEIFPEIVTRWKLSDDCKDALAVDYPRFVPVLIEAIKEQQNIIENQNKKIDNLIARISVLESKLE